MDLFQSILAGIKRKLDKESAHTDTIARIATEVLGITVTPDMVRQKGSHVSFILPPTARMKLTLKRQALLLALRREIDSIVSV